jgi:cell division protein FtsW
MSVGPSFGQPYVPGFGAALAQGQPRRGTRWSEVKIWWREVDRVLLGLILALMVIGTAAVAAGSPASARRLSTASEKLPDLYFYWIHLRWQLAGLVVMFAASALDRDNARRVGVELAGAMLCALLLVPLIGYEVNGAKRWIRFGLGFQPSEFLKPGFAIALAWVLSWRLRDPHLPVLAVVTALMGLVGMLLMLQPDLGSAVLFGGVWFVLVVLSGVSMKKIGGMIGAGIAAITAAYFLYDNARHRIDAFLGGGSEFDQVGLAEKTLLGGGWTGTGFWLGLKKMSLPEAHTDYVFSVIGEEFGLLTCALVVILFLAIVARVLVRLADEENLFALLASAGLVTQIGGQAFINILVNLQLFPSKGMTLPLVSYGGSSTIAICLGVGLLLALTRRNPFLTRETPGLRAILAERGITDKEKGA